MTMTSNNVTKKKNHSNDILSSSSSHLSHETFLIYACFSLNNVLRRTVMKEKNLVRSHVLKTHKNICLYFVFNR